MQIRWEIYRWWTYFYIIGIIWSCTRCFSFRRRFIGCCACFRERLCTSFRGTADKAMLMGWAETSPSCGSSIWWSIPFTQPVASSCRPLLTETRTAECQFLSPLLHTILHTLLTAVGCFSLPLRCKSLLCWNWHNQCYALSLGRSCSTSV